MIASIKAFEATQKVGYVSRLRISYESQTAIEFDGKRALAEFLEALAKKERRTR